MTPIKSNLNKDNCSPISSNCVLWQGPDISCIGLCSGDTVSEVTYKLAVEICAIKEELGLSDLDIKCLVDNCLTCPDPEKTLGVVLQLLINKVCNIQEIVDQFGAGSADEVEVRLAQCFLVDFTDSNGDITNPVPVSSYVQKIAQKICSILTKLDDLDGSIVSLGDDITNLETRVDTLENAGELTIVPTCTGTAVATAIDVAVFNLEQKFCNLQTVTGLPEELILVLDKECKFSTPPGYVASLATPGTSLWNPNDLSSTIADTLNKMWLAICDLRGAVKFIQDSCCQISCDDLIVDFDVKRTVDDQGNLILKLFFFPKTNIPGTWYDCDQTPNAIQPYGFQGTKFTVTDTFGNQFVQYVQLRDQTLQTGVLNDPAYYNDGYIFEISNSALDQSTDFSIDSNVCITDGTNKCVKCLVKNVPYVPVASGCCTITALEDEVTIVYRYCPVQITTTTTTVSIG